MLINILNFLKINLNIEVAKKLLLRLLLIDLIFVIIHVATCLLYYLEYIDDFGEYGILVLTQDVSYAEKFQYMKFISLIVFSMYLMNLEKTFAYLSWTLLYLFCFLDDSLSLHELSSELLVKYLHLQPMFGLRAVDFGELIFMAACGSIILLVLGISYLKGNMLFRKRTLICLILLGFLVLFGVGFDMLHEILGENLKVGFVIGLIEDGGEMFIATLMVANVYQLIFPVETYTTFDPE